MRKFLLPFLVLFFGLTVMGQQTIQLRSVDKAECVKSDMKSLKASFSFSSIQADDVDSERGTFSWLSMPNTVIGGIEGDPQIPVVNELIAVPFGANPIIRVTNYSTTDYRLEDLNVNTLVPRQPSLRKDQKPEDVPFVMNESAYQTRGLRSEPQAMVNVVGTMRGVQLGKMTIEPVSYDPVSNTLRVFNDIEVEVSFDGADAKATEDMLIETYSPYFDIVYKQLFNERALRDAYSAHPDLYKTPVKMLVVTTSTYVNSTAFQNWLTWKKQKGIDVDVQTVASGASASTIQNLIYSRYNTNHPTFLVIVGDETVVTYYQLWDYDSSYGDAATDLEYASVDGDVYHDMFISRMSVSSTDELNNLVNKILTYEKYTMSDPSYLSNVLLIAGADGTWAPKVGRPTINYAADNYYNTAHGFVNVYKYVTDTYTGCYNYLSSGVGFANYTAHGDIQKWHNPEFTNTNVGNLTNDDKYFWAMGNCCLTCNFKNAQNNLTCYGEAMIRAANKGAFGYIGSVPESYWWEDYYFGVGATSTYSQTPTMSQTQTGVYDAMFDDTGFNTLNAVPFIGNVAVTYAHAGSYQSSVTDEYYWRAYQCFGDGSVMPYHTEPAANTVSHINILPLGASSFTVSADAGSYVSITVNDEIIGVAAVPSSGTVDVDITAQNTPGTAMIVVTRSQRQPYITTIPIVGGEQYDIYANANPSNGGTVAGAGRYYEDTQCTLVATPNLPQYEFTNWKKDNSIVSNSASYTFTVTSTTAGTYTANFTKLTAHNITCNTVSNGTISADKSTAYKNETVTLTATPATGYVFNGWSVNNGSVTVNSDNTFIMPDANVTISATFTKGHNVTLASVSNGTISADPICALQGMTINLTATPESGFLFDSWVVYETGDVTNTVTVNGDSFTMPNHDVTVVGVFVEPQGGDITIGSGTTTSSSLPTNVWYKYTTSQQIYTQAEVGDAGTITAISFNYNGNAESGDRTLDVYMTHTTSTSLSTWVAVTSATKVYSGTQSFNSAGWYTIILDTPFEYNGTNNIMITVDDNTGSYTGTSGRAFYTYSTGSTRAIYYQSDSNNQTPMNPSSSYSANTTTYNNQIIFTKEVPSTDGYLSVSPESLSGFSYPEGQGPCESQSIAIIGRNLQNNLTVTAPSHYEVSGAANGTYSASLSLTPSNGNVQTMVYVRLRSDLAAGNYNNESLTLVSGTASQSVILSGTVLEGSGTYYSITAAAEPEVGGTVEGAGRYEESAQVTLTATANAGYSFVNWTKDGNVVCTGVCYSFEVTENAAYVANFSRNSYTIMASANPTEGGTVTGAGSYYEGTPITLTATANAGYTFINWTKNGTVVSTEPSFNLTVTAGGSYVANFEVIESHNITVVQSEGGTIGADHTTAYPGDVVTLTVNTNNGFFFVDWTVTDAHNQVVIVTNNQFTMPSSDVTVAATFSEGFVITLAEVEHGTISASQVTAQPGDLITMTATPDEDCIFTTWYAYKTGDTRVAVTMVGNSFRMPAYDVTVMAVFKTIEVEDITVGNGTESNKYLPTYAYYNYSLSQQIYTAAEVGTEGSITDIAFKVSNSKSTTRNLDIYMRATDLTAFASTSSWETMGPSYKVFSGNVTFLASGWTTIHLTTPFEYDGVKNLNLCVVDNTGTYVSGSGGSNAPQFYVYDTDSNRALYVYTDDAAYSNVSYSTISNYSGTQVTYNNQVTFTINVPGSAESLTVSPNTLDGFTYEAGYGPSNVSKLDLVGVDLSDDITLTAPADFEISATENGTYGQTLTINREGSKGHREVTNWDFEGTLLDWTAIDADGDGHNWMVSTDLMSTFSNGHSGTNALSSESYDKTNTTALTPDNWLVSPQVTLGGTFSMWAMAQDAAWPAEHFGVYFSTTSNTDLESFTLLNEWTLTAKSGGKASSDTRDGNRASGAWYEFTVDLSLYEGQTGYLAVRHFNCSDFFYINVDDFELDLDAGYTPVLPVTLTPATVFVRMKDYLDEGSYSGTLTATTGSITSNVSLSGQVTRPVITQAVSLAQGWNWWTPTVEATMSDLQTALTSYAANILTMQNGVPTSLVPGQMYKIWVNAACNINLSGYMLDPVTVTFTEGLNGFGYTGAQATIGEALNGLNPAEGDMINSFDDGFARFDDGAWVGTLTTLYPGRGYVYVSKASGAKTVTF